MVAAVGSPVKIVRLYVLYHCGISFRRDYLKKKNTANRRLRENGSPCCLRGTVRRCSNTRKESKREEELIVSKKCCITINGIEDIDKIQFFPLLLFNEEITMS